MGYTTDFWGQIDVVPPLNDLEIAYLTKFADTRRVDREQGPYFIDGAGYKGQDSDPGTGVRDGNRPPEGQPGLWCQWVPTDDGTGIEWDGGEKFYDAAEWMKYLIDHFIGLTPIAAHDLPFLTGHVCNGVIGAQGEDSDDRWDLTVKDNQVFVSSYTRVGGELYPV